MIGNEIWMKIKEAQTELDDFNLRIAEFRAGNGMSNTLRQLYAAMGRLDQALVECCRIADLSEYIIKIGYDEWI